MGKKNYCNTEFLTMDRTRATRQNIDAFSLNDAKKLWRRWNIEIELAKLRRPLETIWEQKEPSPRKQRSAALPMGAVGQRTIKLIALEDSVSKCPVKKALIATKTPFEEAQYDRFKTF